MRMIIIYDLIRKYEYTRDQLVEFKKELEIKAKGPEEDNSGQQSSGLGALGGFSAAPVQVTSVKKSSDGSSSDSSRTTSTSVIEGLRPIWQNKDSMSPLMKQVVQAQEIR